MPRVRMVKSWHRGHDARSLALARGLSKVTTSVYRGPIRRLIARGLDRNRQVTRPRIAFSRGHADLHGLRIAFLSDVHAGSFMQEADLERLFGRVAEESPDLVLLGGDLIDYHAHEALLLRKGLALLQPRFGVHAVPGNHEYHADPSLATWRPVLEDLGINVLVNRGLRIHVAEQGAAFWLAGVDDVTEGHPDIAAALHGRHEDEPVVLLSHHPDFFVEAQHHDVDLVLSGHTHGGQILPFGRALTRHTRMGWWSGHFEAQGSQLYVGRGAGVGFLPIRIGARGEVAMLQVEVGVKDEPA